MTARVARTRRWLFSDLRHTVNWVFLVPTLIFFIGYQVYPIIRVFLISFTDFHFLRPGTANWVGLENYINALTDPLVHKGLLRAAYFTALFLPLTIFIPMVLAVMIDRVKHPRLATTYRLILLIPAVIPGPLVFVLWKWMYNFNIGAINYFLINILHVVGPREAPMWLGGTPLTIPAIVVMELWWGLGYHTMFFLAGLAAIPKELFEAARVDGANEWHLFWRITVPRLRPVLLVLLVLRFGTAMAVIDEYLIMGGFNRTAPTYTWTVYMWDLAFQLGDWFQGYAAAVGWIGTAFMLVVVVFLFHLFRPRD